MIKLLDENIGVESVIVNIKFEFLLFLFVNTKFKFLIRKN